MCSNKIPLIIFILAVSQSAIGACKAVIWTIEEEKIAVCYDDKAAAMLSVDCENKPCGARLLKIDAKKVVLDTPDRDSSKNPGSVYCSNLSGRVVLGRNERGSQNAFCQAQDGSLIDLSALAND